MKKIGLFFVSLFVLLASGCAGTDYVETFYDMGCSSSFGDIVLSKGTDVSTTYPLEVVTQINCNADVSVTINFYDDYYPGHYKYFLVNGYSTYYGQTIYTETTDYSNGRFIFTTDDSLYEQGSYYGIYEVTAVNLETDEYTIHQYKIQAHDEPTLGKIEPAAGNFKARPAPQILSDNSSYIPKMEDNETGEIL